LKKKRSQKGKTAKKKAGVAEQQAYSSPWERAGAQRKTALGKKKGNRKNRDQFFLRLHRGGEKGGTTDIEETQIKRNAGRG